MSLITVIFLISLILLCGYVFFHIFTYRIFLLEKKIISAFSSRSDTIPSLFEVSKNNVVRHNEIFWEVLSLRKKEFSLRGISENLESFIEVEQYIHHEINFIFQICNKNPWLLKQKRFLYIRDIIMNKSSTIGKLIRTYNKIIEIYNSLIKIKNYSIIGLLLPFSKKTSI